VGGGGGDSAGVCQTDMDCNLNGLCAADSGLCRCDPAWDGPTCGRLAVLPTPADNGYNVPGTASWGGNAIYDPATKLYHGFFSEFVLHCGLRSWGCNSRIVHATASTPVGPYAFSDEALPPQAHNAHIARDPVSERYLLYHIHTPTKRCGGPAYNCSIHGCTNGTTPLALQCPSEGGAVGAANWSVTSGALHTSASLSGPWLGVQGDVGCNNPSPWIEPDGQVVRVCTDGYRPNVDTAPSFAGPYTTPSINISCPNLSRGLNGTPGSFHSEDAVLWRDRRGNYHIFSHAMGPSQWPPPSPKYLHGHWPDQYGVHAYSKDGAQWLCSDEPAYNGTVLFGDGTVVNTTRRERPKVLLDAEGDLLVLFTGVQMPPNHDHGPDRSYTLAVPIRNTNKQP